MANTVPAHVNRRVLERAVTELRTWKRHAIKAWATEPDEERRQVLRRHADDVEYVEYRLGLLIHPATEGDR